MNMMTTDRGMMMPGMNMGAGMMSTMPAGMGMGGMPTMAPGMMGMMMPRCRMTFEKTDGGMRMTCVCDDKASAAMLQSLCMMMQGGMCSCAMVMNGMTCCQCNLCMGTCKMEMMDMGV